VNDGSVNQSNYDTVSLYVADLNEYFRTKVLQASFNGQISISDMSFDISQMLISCRFMDAPCSATDFFQYFDYYYGFCYRFNQGIDLNGNPLNISTVGVAGTRYGLELELYAGYVSGQEYYVPTRGFRISVFNKSSVDQMVREQGIDIPTGMNTNIEVTRTFLTHLSQPFSNCLPTDITQINWNTNVHLQYTYKHYVDGSYFPGLINPYTGVDAPNWNWTLIYSQFFCLKLCFQKYLFEQCGCYDLTIPMTQKNIDYYSANACNTDPEINCQNNHEQIFYSDDSLFGQCYTDCPMECEQIQYGLRVTTSVYPTQWYANLLASSSGFNSIINRYFNKFGKANISFVGNYTDLKNAVAKVIVYYSDLSYTQIDQSEAMPFAVFLGNIGGNLGLFLGECI
jgi:hypothetical protein